MKVLDLKVERGEEVGRVCERVQSNLCGADIQVKTIII